MYPLKGVSGFVLCHFQWEITFMTWHKNTNTVEHIDKNNISWVALGMQHKVPGNPPSLREGVNPDFGKIETKDSNSCNRTSVRWEN